MAFPCRIVHGRQPLFIYNIHINPTVEKNLKTIDVAFARSMKKWRPLVEFVWLIQVGAIFL